MPDSSHRLADQKHQIREQARAARRAQRNKDELSRRIMARFMALDEYQRARTVLFYVDARAEVRTREALADALASGKRIVVPYCADGHLELFHLTSLDELEEGTYRILEPRVPLRDLDAKRADVDQLDLILVPGVAFDRRGGRAGHGQGYYDRLLGRARPGTPLVAAAFQCQLFEEVPTDDHDVLMDMVVTENTVYRRSVRKG